MKKTLIFMLAVAGTAMAQSCGRLSSEAREIAGSYVIPEVSQTEPVMELNRDASCVVRAIKPGVLTYAVEGTWNVENDSLVMILDSSTLKVDGDASLVGQIPVRSARKVVGHNDFSLQLESDGIVYFYKRL